MGCPRSHNGTADSLAPSWHSSRPAGFGRPRHFTLFVPEQLATELCAALFSNVHVHVGVAWQRASAGDWLRYGADVSRLERH